MLKCEFVLKAARQHERICLKLILEVVASKFDHTRCDEVDMHAGEGGESRAASNAISSNGGMAPVGHKQQVGLIAHS